MQTMPGIRGCTAAQITTWSDLCVAGTRRDVLVCCLAKEGDAAGALRCNRWNIVPARNKKSRQDIAKARGHPSPTVRLLVEDQP